ncbi:hypothetical protein niasHT_026236 [Heterodera trifolii]|uniref:Yippee domain-containing protein n=1 Tax=Heterodera trifolii TaxID=157864 RepID=A0ABD2JC65_9BILA
MLEFEVAPILRHHAVRISFKCAGCGDAIFKTYDFNSSGKFNSCGAMMQMTYELTKFGKRKNIGRPEHEMCTASASDLSGCLMFAGRRKRKENVGDRIDFFFAVRHWRI